MKLKRLLPKKSKKGVTLVEAVFAVVVLAMFATGVLTLLTTGRTKIAETAAEANAYAEATQKLDAVIATISNDNYANDDGTLRLEDLNTTVDGSPVTLPGILDTLGFDGSSGVVLTSTPDYHQKADGTGDMDHIPENTRGWYLTLTYNGATVKGYASNTEGVFDR